MTRGVVVFWAHVPEYTRLIGFEGSSDVLHGKPQHRTRRGSLAGMTDEIYLRGACTLMKGVWREEQDPGSLCNVFTNPGRTNFFWVFSNVLPISSSAPYVRCHIGA
jgi:hypothetical protein